MPSAISCGLWLRVFLLLGMGTEGLLNCVVVVVVVDEGVVSRAERFGAIVWCCG